MISVMKHDCNYIGEITGTGLFMSQGDKRSASALQIFAI